MKRALAFLMLAAPLCAQIKVAALPAPSPVVTLRLVFTTGAMADPAGKPGVAYMTAMMLAQGGTRTMTYKQMVDAMFPMASSVYAQVDQEMTTFAGETHVDNLDAYYQLFRAALLEPGWREDDFRRLKDDAINSLRIGLRGNNDEELGKEVLYQDIYAGTTYGHYSVGTVSSLEKMTLDDVKAFYKAQYTQKNLILGIAGGYPPQFLETLKKDLGTLPKAPAVTHAAPAPMPAAANRLTIVDKDTRSVAYSLGFPISVKRGDPDFPALLLAQSYLGQHRISGGRLYDRMREVRGLNYGDYAYIEYFPRGMFQFAPSPNLARRSQIFQVWIRPVEPLTAKFALRLALFELDNFVREGISTADFERSRAFLGKYVNVLTQTKQAELGYMIDSMFYGIPNYNQYLKTSLAKLTREDVNRAIRRHLRADHLAIVAVTKDGEKLKQELTSDAVSPMTYNSAKPAALLEEDKTVEKFPLNLKPENVKVVPAAQVFE